MSTFVRKPNLIGNPSLFKTDLLYSSSPASVTTRKDTGEVKFQGSFYFTTVSNATALWKANSNLSSSFATAFEASVGESEDAVATLGFGATTTATPTVVFKAIATLESSFTLSATPPSGEVESGEAQLGFGFTIVPTATTTASESGEAQLGFGFTIVPTATKTETESGVAELGFGFTITPTATKTETESGVAELGFGFTITSTPSLTLSAVSSLEATATFTADASTGSSENAEALLGTGATLTATSGITFSAEAVLEGSFTSTQSCFMIMSAESSLGFSATLDVDADTDSFAVCLMSASFTSTSDATLVLALTNEYSIDLDGTDDFMRTPICVWNYDGAGSRLFGHGGGTNLEGFSIQQYVYFDGYGLSPSGQPHMLYGFKCGANYNVSFQAGFHQQGNWYIQLGSLPWSAPNGGAGNLATLGGGGPHGLSTGEWYHIVSTWEPTDVSVDSTFKGKLRIYIDNASPDNASGGSVNGRGGLGKTFDNDYGTYALIIGGVATLDAELLSSAGADDTFAITKLDDAGDVDDEFKWATTDAYKIVQIGTERIKVTATATAGGVLTIAERGVEGTTAQTHASGAEVVSDVFNLALTGQRENIDAKGYRWEHSGWMDEIALWDKTLSSSEVSDLYNGGGGPINLKAHTSTKDNLIGWWRCGDNDGSTSTTITDQSDEGRDGTLVNAAIDGDVYPEIT